MGVILSKTNGTKKGNKKESAFERELAQLDTDITRHEIDLAETRISERRTSVYLFFYSLLAVMASWAFVFFAPNSLSTAGDLALVVGVPVVIYYGRLMVSWVFRRKIAGLEAGLQTLRQRQRLKLEELKDSSGYYQTKGLIERFDPEYKKLGGNLAVISEDNDNGKQPVKQIKVKQEVPEPSTDDKVAFVLPAEPKKTWMDRLVDAMIGDDSRHSKYALICKRCHAHNGLALPDEIMTIVFVCPNCHYENHPRPRDNLVINGENVYTPVKEDQVETVSSVKADPETPQALRRRK